jgi:hypothetical protein
VTSSSVGAPVGEHGKAELGQGGCGSEAAQKLHRSPTPGSRPGKALFIMIGLASPHTVLCNCHLRATGPRLGHSRCSVTICELNEEFDTYKDQAVPMLGLTS